MVIMGCDPPGTGVPTTCRDQLPTAIDSTNISPRQYGLLLYNVVELPYSSANYGAY